MSAHNQRPNIEVFVDDINQEIHRPDTSGVPKQADDNNWPDDWAGQWYDNSPGGPGWTRDWYNDWEGDWRSDWQTDWNQDSSEMIRRIDTITPTFPITNLDLRPEPFGGLAYEPQSKKVFKVNKEGLKLLKMMQASSTNNELLDAGFTLADIHRFVMFLVHHSIDVHHFWRAP